MIIWLASYPRSGNTFFRILMKQIYGITTYSIYNDPLFDHLKGSSDIVGHKKLDINVEKMAFEDRIFFVKTHHLPSDESPAIYLVRDGRDSVVSYAHYKMSFENQSFRNKIKKTFKNWLGWDEYTETLKNLITDSQSDYGNWSENANQWTHRKALTITLKFEDLIANPIDCIDSALINIGFQGQLSREKQKTPSFNELQSQWSKFFRKGKIGSWKDEMSSDLEQMFWLKHGFMMEKLGYHR